MSEPAPVKAVIFDLGHTVWDYAPRENAWKLGVLRFHGRLADWRDAAVPHPTILQDAIANAVSRWMNVWDTDVLEQPPTAVLVGEALADLDLAPPDDVVAELAEAIFGREIEMPAIAPDSVAAFDALHASGIAMGAVSNTITLESGIRDALRRLGMLRYFRSVVASSSMGYKKPHASLFQRALDELGVDATSAVFVGDRLVDDISGAQAAGMRAVLTHQFRQEEPVDSHVRPDAVIQRLAELPTVITGFASGEASGESAVVRS